MTDAPEHPDQLGAFVIEAVLGRGAFGTVYRAVDTRSQRTVALKVLHKSNLSPFTIRRLLAEEEALRTLEDDAFPWFPRVIESGRVDGVPFLAMDYVAGGRIDAFCDERRLDVHARAALFRLVCLAIQKAHQHGILHLDLKPAHLLVHADADPAGGPAPRIIDLGLAQGVDRALVLDESTHRQPHGTPGFMSPELLAGQKGDARADVYALGIVLYWLLSGTRPWRDTVAPPDHAPNQLLPHPAVRFAATMQREPQRGAQCAAQRDATPAALLRVLRGDLGTIVMRAVEPDARRRYQDPGELAADLERFLGHRPIRGRREPMYRARLFMRRNRVGVGIGTGAAVAVAGLIALLGSNLALAKENLTQARTLGSMREERLLASKARFIAGDAAARQGFWSKALTHYANAARNDYPDPLELGIRQVEALEASFDLGQARQRLDALKLLPDAGRQRARLLLLEADLGSSRFDDPDGGLSLAEQAVRLAEQDESALSPAELEYARALLTDEPRAALAHLRRAHSFDGSNHRINTSYAMAMLLIGDRDGMRPFAEVFRTLNPEDEEALYVSIVMLALSGQPDGITDAIATIEAGFGDDAGELARQIVATMELIPWANDLLRANLVAADPGIGTLFGTVTTLLGRVMPLQRAIAERRDEWSEANRAQPLVKVPPCLARRFQLLARAATHKSPRPQSITAALTGLKAGEVDGILILIHAMGLVNEDRPAALARTDEALSARSFLLDRRTALLFGCLLGATTFMQADSQDLELRTAVHDRVVPWLTEAAERSDWSAREMAVLFDTANGLREPGLAGLMARRALALAPNDLRTRINFIEALAIDGALTRADRLLRELAPDLKNASDADQKRFADIRSALDAALAKLPEAPPQPASAPTPGNGK